MDSFPLSCCSFRFRETEIAFIVSRTSTFHQQLLIEFLNALAPVQKQRVMSNDSSFDPAARNNYGVINITRYVNATATCIHFSQIRYEFRITASQCVSVQWLFPWILRRKKERRKEPIEISERRVRSFPGISFCSEILSSLSFSSGTDLLILSR